LSSFLTIASYRIVCPFGKPAEEFVASNDFVQWFAVGAGLDRSEDLRLVQARRSVTHSIGESDLETDSGWAETDGALDVEVWVRDGFRPTWRTR